MADLAYTTADAHFLAQDWPKQHPQLGGAAQVHAFLNHPSIAEFYEAIDASLADLADRDRCNDWSRFGLTVTFAGHGEDSAGGLVLADGELHAVDIIDHLRSKADRNHTEALRLGFVLDSCFSGEFLLRFLDEIRDDRTVLPQHCFASAMFDEVAWEDPGLGHGIGTYCFSVKNSLSAGLLSEGIQADNAWGPALAAVSGFRGLALLTLGRQHAVQLNPNGEIHTTIGATRYWDGKDGWFSSAEIRSELSRLRDEANTHITALNPSRSAKLIRSNQDVFDLLPSLDDLVRLQDPTQAHMSPGGASGEQAPEIRFFMGRPDTPQPW